MIYISRCYFRLIANELLGGELYIWYRAANCMFKKDPNNCLHTISKFLSFWRSLEISLSFTLIWGRKC